jgi:hypothetical protein
MADGFLLLACTAKLQVLDVAHDGKVLGSVDTGKGVDDLDYVAATHTAYAAAGKDGNLTIATLDAKGALGGAKTLPTTQGARNGVVTSDAIVYVAHSAGSELLKVPTATGASH